MTQLRSLEATANGNAVRIVEAAEVVKLGADRQGWTAALTTGEALHVDRVLLATGVEVDVRKDPLLAPFVDEMAVTTAASSSVGGR